MSYLILDQAAATYGSSIGGKASSLAALCRQGFPIPRWAVILPQACTDSQSTDTAQSLTFKPNEALAAEVQQFLRKFCSAGERLAVRSSAAEEDGTEHSFAGILESRLFVAPEMDDVLQAITEVWKSAYSERMLAYRRECGLETPLRPPAVILQHMINADVAGVAFAADPASGQRGLSIVSAVYGLGSGLVSGECNADTYYLDSDSRLLKRMIAPKSRMHRFSASLQTLTSENVPENLVNFPALSDAQASVVGRLVQATSQFFGCPQDIEWAIADEQLFLLQSRPITSQPASSSLQDNQPEYTFWDNTTLVESWNGLTKPLTQSVARELVAAVYIQLSRHTCLPKVNPEAPASKEKFLQLFHAHQGRLYINQTALMETWYDFPSIQYMLNKAFQQTRGLLGLPSEWPAVPLTDVLSLWQQVLKALSHLVAYEWRLTDRIPGFIKRVDTCLLETGAALGSSDAGRLLQASERCLDVIRQDWEIPAINNYLATRLYGLSTSLSTRMMGASGPGYLNRYLEGDTDTLSQDIARKLNRMAALLRQDESLLSLFQDGEQAEILAALETNAALKAAYSEYMERYGSRCQEDLKLESPSLREHPLPLFRLLGAQALMETPPAAGAGKLKTPVAGFFLKPLLACTKNRTRQRERLRFELTRLMEQLRTLYRQLAVVLTAQGVLREADDIFHLEKEELAAVISGELPLSDAQKRIEQRKQDWLRYLAMPAPPGQFDTFGQAFLGSLETANHDHSNPLSRHGQAASPGVITAPVCLLGDTPDPAELAGKILVAEFGDSGLVSYFPLLKGLIFEHGSPLSHACIVARELGIPAVVGVPNLREWLTAGDQVELDGHTGRIRKTAEN